MSITLEVTALAGKSNAPGLSRQLRKVLNELARSSLTHVSVVLVGDTRMSSLHGRFMNDPTPTDVLTFELEHDAKGRCTEGEIVVCVDEARRASRRVGTRPEDELLLYAVHGVLHLCGYDDRDERSYRAMHQREDRLLRDIGVGAVFAPGRMERAGSRPRMNA
jgi:rRNA maturation RNase YbeY